MTDELRIVEVGPRDGLQNESVIVSTADKVALVAAAVDAGLRRVEAVSFAHPRLVPAMADAEAVMAAVPRVDGVSYAGLVLNRRGLDRARGAGVDEVNVVVVATDEFSRRNQNVTTADALAAALDVVAGARAAGLGTTVTIGAAFGCPFEGEVPPARVVELARRVLAAGADEVCLADTIGVGVPVQVTRFCAEVTPLLAAGQRLRFHFHNTRNTGYANAAEALRCGVRVLDASAAGIGGCPFAPAATGNIATEDLVNLAERSGVPTGVDLAALLPTAPRLAALLGHDVPALLPRAGIFPPPSPPLALNHRRPTPLR